ncbi:MAG: DNA polymerase family B elongation subunit [Hyperionvirus sp.]|uniref:DNA polymerase family B elongation subunit n=1 Tax=Hyperionvirus sp. TaxID=2487770 RepID=A0A3G5AEL9_9VIRU|nr:MAG: DNA polymerase family B elongation subunit [Hyperionvirus sp.]
MYDIECVSADDTFPDPNREFDQIIQIAITYLDSNVKYILVLGECDPIPDGVKIESYKTETELLTAWIALMEKPNSLAIPSHKFDQQYLSDRLIKLGLNK